MQSKMVDLLNPLATIQWEKRGSGPDLMSVVQFKDKLIAQDFHHLQRFFSLE
jgi:hypothetical protein